MGGGAAGLWGRACRGGQRPRGAGGVEIGRRGFVLADDFGSQASGARSETLVPARPLVGQLRSLEDPALGGSRGCVSLAPLPSAQGCGRHPRRPVHLGAQSSRCGHGHGQGPEARGPSGRAPGLPPRELWPRLGPGLRALVPDPAGCWPSAWWGLVTVGRRGSRTPGWLRGSGTGVLCRGRQPACPPRLPSLSRGQWCACTSPSSRRGSRSLPQRC